MKRKWQEKNKIESIVHNSDTGTVLSSLILTQYKVFSFA